MTNKSIIQLVLLIIIIAGILMTYWSFSQAVSESLEHARNLNFKEWGESLVSLFLTGITLAFAGAIGEIILFFLSPPEQQIW